MKAFNIPHSPLIIPETEINLLCQKGS